MPSQPVAVVSLQCDWWLGPALSCATQRGSTGQEEELYIDLSEKLRCWRELSKCEEVGKDYFIIGDETLALIISCQGCLS